MKRLLIATTALTLLVAPMSGAFAQNWNDRNNTTTMQRHDDRRPDNGMQMQGHDNGRQTDYRNDRHDNGQHRGWYKGGRIDRSDWNRGQRVSDYRRYHLQAPPRGYEWRRVDNNYILAAAATGLILNLAMANH